MGEILVKGRIRCDWHHLFFNVSVKKKENLVDFKALTIFHTSFSVLIYELFVFHYWNILLSMWDKTWLLYTCYLHYIDPVLQFKAIAVIGHNWNHIQSSVE